jgi:hypothetical protein
MRTIALTTLIAATLATTLGAPSAFAQKGDYRHHDFCLLTGPARECAYDTFAQCEASKHGSTDSCVKNSPPQDH